MARKRATRRATKASAAKGATAVTFASVPGFLKVNAALKAIVNAIVQEIIDEMNLTLASVGKSFTPNALDEWRRKLSNSVLTQMMQGGNWATDRPNVLAVARDMAIIASILCGPLTTVNRGRVHASFRAVKDHETCPGPTGGGRWCDFDI